MKKSKEQLDETKTSIDDQAKSPKALMIDVSWDSSAERISTPTSEQTTTTTDQSRQTTASNFESEAKRLIRTRGGPEEAVLGLSAALQNSRSSNRRLKQANIDVMTERDEIAKKLQETSSELENLKKMLEEKNALEESSVKVVEENHAAQNNESDGGSQKASRELGNSKRKLEERGVIVEQSTQTDITETPKSAGPTKSLATTSKKPASGSDVGKNNDLEENIQRMIDDYGSPENAIRKLLDGYRSSRLMIEQLKKGGETIIGEKNTITKKLQETLSELENLKRRLEESCATEEQSTKKLQETSDELEALKQSTKTELETLTQELEEKNRIQAELNEIMEKNKIAFTNLQKSSLDDLESIRKKLEDAETKNNKLEIAIKGTVERNGILWKNFQREQESKTDFKTQLEALRQQHERTSADTAQQSILLENKISMIGNILRASLEEERQSNLLLSNKIDTLVKGGNSVVSKIEILGDQQREGSSDVKDRIKDLNERIISLNLEQSKEIIQLKKELEARNQKLIELELAVIESELELEKTKEETDGQVSELKRKLGSLNDELETTEQERKKLKGKLEVLKTDQEIQTEESLVTQEIESENFIQENGEADAVSESSPSPVLFDFNPRIVMKRI